LLFPELKSAAEQIGDLMQIARSADQSNIVRRGERGQEEEGDWQFGVALHGIPMYQLQSLSKNLSSELQRARAVGSSANLSGMGSGSRPQSPAGSQENLPALRQRQDQPTTAQKMRKMPLEELLNIIGRPARYLFREMWLWSERDLVLYGVVIVFVLEVWVAWQYFAWTPVCLLFPLISSSSGSRMAENLQEELTERFVPEHRLARRLNVPVVMQVLICHNMLIYLVVVLTLFGGVDPYTGSTPKWQTFVYAGVLFFVSIIGCVGTNLVWACRTVEASLSQKVLLMLCNSVANQGSIFRWSRDHRSHLTYRGTDADPYDHRDGVPAFYSYIGWFVLRKQRRVGHQEHA
jgi:hypothetical protein